MIEVDLPTLFVLYLFGSLALLLLAWIFYERGHKAPHVQPADEQIYRCAICAHVYLDDRDATFSKCPQCGSMNDFGRK